MNITEKIDYILSKELQQVLCESGIRNINDLAKSHKTAEIYFHQDLDGVTSAIAIKKYLEKYHIKTTDTHMINYGDMEYSVPKPKNDTLHVLCDFAHGKDSIMHIWTDHHDKQINVNKKTSTAFVQTPSNAEYISTIIPNTDIFPRDDLKIISMVDSADYAKNGITPDEVMTSVFSYNDRKSIEKNKTQMGLVVNKLLLAYKNKKEFLERLVLLSEPSLMSMFNVIVHLAKKEGYREPKDLQKAMDNYVSIQKEKIKTGDINEIKTLKTGDSIDIENIVIQYGSSALMSKDVLYDRYTVFKNHPNSTFLVMGWPVGLVQVSINPFKKDKPDIHLGNLADKVLNEKYKSKFENIQVSLDFIKWTFEKKVKELSSMGFNFGDFISLFSDHIKGMNKDNNSKWNTMISDITNKHYMDLSQKQKDILKKITVSAWDIIKEQSGGHKAITNIQGINFIGKGYVDILKDIMIDLTKELIKIQR